MRPRALKIWSGIVMAVAFVGALLVAVGTTPATAQPDKKDDRSKGLVYEGLTPGQPGTKCEGNYQMPPRSHSKPCSHGPDATPPGVDARYPSPAATATSSPSTVQGSAAVPCYGDGVSGDRIEAIYAHTVGTADRYASLLPQLQTSAAAADDVFNSSAAETGGTRHLRFVTDASCNLVVRDVQLTSTGADSFGNTINELLNQGFNRSDRKYLVWVDKNVYCGIAEVIPDDAASQANSNNGSDALFARVDSGCWGLAGQSVEAHELMHTMGGVQTSAPHATKYNHCWDEADRMCYDDGSGTAMQSVCPSSHENRFDCNHDDYYSTNPPPGSYLATHWNTANSAFLAQSAPASSPTPSAPATPPAGWHPWESLGGSLASSPDVASWAAGRLDVVAKGTGGDLQHKWFDGAWHPWESLGGSLASDPTAVSWSAGRLDVFAKGPGGDLQHRWFDGVWHPWESLGVPAGGMASGPDAASWAPGRLDIFAQGQGGDLQHIWFNGAWHPWESLGGSLASDPTVAAWSANRLDVFAKGTGGDLQHKWFDGAWHPWESLGVPANGLNSGPDVASWAPGRLDIFAQGQGADLQHIWFDGAWHSWESLGGSLASDPGAESWSANRLDVFAKAADNTLSHIWFG